MLACMESKRPEHDGLVRSVAQGLRQRCGVREGDAVLVACSGGADSTALLRVLHVLSMKRRWRLSLTVAHVHHHARGASADDDAEFVSSLCGALSLPYARLDLTAGAYGDENAEGRWRRERYAALLACAAEQRCGLIATGHHGDDQAETVLMRLMRGTSVAGLRGIAWRRALERTSEVRLVRPMLAATRSDVLAFLSLVGQAHRHDASNDDVTRVRSRLRRDVLPVLRELSPAFAERVSGLVDHAHEVHALVLDEARRYALPMRREAARSLQPAVLTVVLREALLGAGASADAVTGRVLGSVARAARDEAGGRRAFVIGGVRLWVTRDALEVDGRAWPG